MSELKNNEWNEESRAAFMERIRKILDHENSGVVLIMDDEYVDYAYDVTVTEFRDALLSLARDLAAYPGDE